MLNLTEMNCARWEGPFSGDSAAGVDHAASSHAELKIRRLTLDKASELLDLLQRSLEPAEKETTRQTAKARRLVALSIQLDDPCSTILAASMQGRLVGGISVGALHGLDPAEGIGEIRDLVVDEGFRRRGIGQMLLQTALEASRGLGFKRIYLEISANMTSAQRLFKRFGFRPVKTEARVMRNDAEQPCYYLLEDAENLLKAVKSLR